jgi:hypothetical protein
MDRTTVRAVSETEVRAAAGRPARPGNDLPAFQTRTCAHCGHQTTFVLQDLAGWYACSACGRYA